MGPQQRVMRAILTRRALDEKRVPASHETIQPE
jgi:hypothetical protein